MIKKTVKKEVSKKSPAVKHVVKPSAKKEVQHIVKGRFIETIGRRKTSIARVRLTADSSGIKVNGKDYKDYLKIPKLQEIVAAPLNILELTGKHGFSVVVSGGGITSQAEAIRHGISRALVKLNAEFKKRLKKHGFIIRDPRMVERKKYGLKKARRAPQWAKR